MLDSLTCRGGKGWTGTENGRHANPETALIFPIVLLADAPLLPGAADCIRRLSAKVPLAIASGALRVEIESVLNGVHLRHFFTHIVASGETGRAKPAPDPYLRAASLLGVLPSNCVAIEDSKWGLESARGAGLRTVALTHTFSAPDLRQADLLVNRLDEVTFDRLSALVERM